VAEVTVRPMTDADVEAATRVQLAAFTDLARRNGEPEHPITHAQRDRTRQRHLHFIANDPDGSWVATDGDTVVGCALALRREGLWGLSLLAVDPALQSKGAGRRLLNAALDYSEGCDRAIILSSTDSRAIRSYATSGFALFPQVFATGVPSLEAAPSSMGRVRDGSAADWDLADEIDRGVRGAGRGPDHELVSALASMYVVDDEDGRGYVYLRDGETYVLAATDEATATALLWRCFRHCDDHDLPTTVEHITGEQQWAITACLAARLAIRPGGPVFWRDATPPRSYLPSGAFL
jgi:GNAT superfamily N-acetyltransferase